MSTRSERIKALIEQSGLSYQELEKTTGIKKSSLQRYASGATPKIPLDVIEKLSKAFNVSQEYLLGWSDDVKIASPEAPRLTESEVRLILAYRSKPEMQHSVNVLLGIQDGADIVEDMVQTIKGTKKIQI